jgi:hypothetical protein
LPVGSSISFWAGAPAILDDTASPTAIRVRLDRIHRLLTRHWHTLALVPDALFVDGFFNSRRVQIATMAARDRVPASYSVREYVEVGGLTSYRTNLEDMFRRSGLLPVTSSAAGTDAARRADEMIEWTRQPRLTQRPGYSRFQRYPTRFVALVKKGILSKIEAEEMFRRAIDAIKTASATDQAAELLAGILERLSKFKPGPWQ